MVLEVGAPQQKIALRRAPHVFNDNAAVSSVEPVRLMQKRDIFDAQLGRMPKKCLGTLERRVREDRSS